MTRTEERLIDALGAVGRSVRQEALPPLPGHCPAAEPGRWGRWLAPLAAAASVVLVVVLVGALHLFSGRPPGGAAIGPPPRYYVSEQAMSIQVRDTATGAVTASLRRPFSGPRHFGMYANVVAAGGGGDREFVAEYTGSRPHSTVTQTRLYSFHVTGAGRVAGLALVKGGRLGHFTGGTALAVSPDGSQVAAVVYRTVGLQGPRPLPQIMVVNLRTGAHSLWAGGLQRAGLYLSIPSISWGPGGRFLVFLGQWCHAWLLGEICGTGPHFSQVRTLRVGPGGGRLSDGSALLSQSARYAYLAQALLSPDGKALTVVALGPAGLAPDRSIPQNFRVVRVPLRGAGAARLLYRGVLSNDPYVFLGSDASGRHLLLSGRLNGWIDHGRLRLLASPVGGAFTDAW